MTRLIGSGAQPPLDPFLMLDFFGSERAGDYIGGFPDHPHRGFETVTYMLAGRMRHSDNHGHSGVIEAGDVQWMKAGRGLIHSEMPEQDHGLMRGFQLWINLPAAEKMSPPGLSGVQGGADPGRGARGRAGQGHRRRRGLRRGRPGARAACRRGLFRHRTRARRAFPAGRRRRTIRPFSSFTKARLRRPGGGRERDRLAGALALGPGEEAVLTAGDAGRARPVAGGTAVARADRLERPLRDEQPRRADPGL